MPLDLNAVAIKRAVMDVEFLGESAAVTYNPSMLTAENIAKARANQGAGFVDFMTDVILDWDVRKGTRKVPINEKTLNELPLGFLRAVFLQLAQGGGSGDPTTDNNSNDG